MGRSDLALASVVGGVLLLASGSVFAGDDVLDGLDLPVACSEDLLAGVYGFNTDGFVVEEEGDRVTVLEGARQAGTGIVDFRADGTAVFRLERFFSGVPELEGEEGPFFDEFEATWHVRPDCTGTADLIEFGFDIDWIFVAVAGARELHFVSGAGTLSEVDSERLFSEPPAPLDELPEVCSKALLVGTYGFNFDTLADPSGGARAGVGLLDLSKSGSLRLKLEGFEEGGTAPFMHFERGHWEVREDCTGVLDLRGGELWTFVAVRNGTKLHLVMQDLLEEADAERLFPPESVD